MTYSQHVDKLATNVTDQVVQVMGLPNVGWMRRWMRTLFWAPAHRLATLGVVFDDYVAEHGFADAARLAVRLFTFGSHAYGVEHIPSEGPVLITANHPGTIDSLVVSTYVRRRDYRIVAGNVPFFHNLPATSQYLIRCKPDAYFRISTFRNSVQHLESGGALLIFPSSQIDPDPAIMPGAREELGKWSRSLEIMLRLVPETQVVVAIVSGILLRGCVRNPLTWVRRSRAGRQTVGELIQMVPQLLFGWRYALSPTVSFAEPLSTADLCPSGDVAGAAEAIIGHARQHLVEHLALAAGKFGTDRDPG